LSQGRGFLDTLGSARKRDPEERYAAHDDFGAHQDRRLHAHGPEYFTVTPGQKIAGILTGTTPTAIMSVTEVV
jgi:hypothetical protein